MMGEARDITANPVEVRLLDSYLDELEGKLIVLPSAALVSLATRDNAPEVWREEDNLSWPRKSDFAYWNNLFALDCVLPPAIGFKCAVESD